MCLFVALRPFLELGQRVDQVGFAFGDDADFLCELWVVFQETGDAVFCGRPVWSNFFIRIFLFLFLLFGLLLLPISFTPGINLCDRIGYVDLVVFIATSCQQHLQRLAFRVAMLAVAGEHVVIRDDAIEEVLVQVI